MTDEPTRTPETPDDDSKEQDSILERWELLDHVQAILEPIMVGLGLVFLLLLLVDYSDSLTDPRHGFWLSRSLTIIWVIFLVEFLFRFVIAPAKLSFLKSNWLSAASLALPFLRPIRALRALRAVRSLNLLRLIGGVNRGMRILRQVIGGHQIGYLISLTLVVTLFSSVGIWYFERDSADASIQSFGDGLWWASAMVTTINHELSATTAEGRVLAILLRIYAVSVFGFITATIARYLIGRDVLGFAGDVDESRDSAARLESLERELVLLRQALAGSSVATTPASSDIEDTQPGGRADSDRRESD